MIVWFIDRFGLPGQYHRIWAKLLKDSGIPGGSVRVISLHNVMKRTLLQKHSTRKAPTWIPEETGNITRCIENVIAELKPKAVVLASPESLACLGLHPDHATLQALRGSVYWRSGVPHLVMLPMSAWNSLVSQKEIGAANYGFESADAFSSSRQQGEISESASAGSRARLDDNHLRDGSGDGSHHRHPSGFELRASGQGDGDYPAHESASPAGDSADGLTQADLASRTGGGPASDSGVLHNDAAGQGGGDGLRTPVLRDLPSAFSGLTLDLRVRPAPRIEGSSDSADPRGNLPSGSGGGPDGSSDHGVGTSHGSLREDVGGHADGDDSGGDEEDELTEDGEGEPEPGDVDQFFYEPVLSPVGRFVLTADTLKLFRIVRDGKNAAGPAKPIELHWR